MKSAIVIDPETVSVAGLNWDTKNLSEDHFNFLEANGLASINGKRLPTSDEFDRLLDCPNIWDSDLKGMWFADNENDLKNPYKSVFFPASGGRGGSSGALRNAGSGGYYWSSSSGSTSRGRYLYLRSGNAARSYGNRSSGFSVRCVAK